MTNRTKNKIKKEIDFVLSFLNISQQKEELFGFIEEIILENYYKGIFIGGLFIVLMVYLIMRIM
jgi:hypothetical protein